MHFLRSALLLVSLLLFIDVKAQYELPSPVPPGISQVVPAGSLIIPMDTTSQKLPGYFNLKAYGLVNHLLQNEVPVKWAIKSNKTKSTATTGIDFAASVYRVFPDTGSLSTVTFRSGPFIIDSAWVSIALPYINAFEAANGNKIVVFKLNTSVTIDIRYQLTFKPKICLLNHQGYDTITVRTLNDAGIPSANYTLRTPANQVFNENLKYSLLSDAHYANGDTAHMNPVLRWVAKGGNLIAGCAGQGSYENSSLTFTSAGIDTVPAAVSSSVTSATYLNHFLPISQFDGILAAPNGEYKYWFLKSGSSFRSNAYQSFRYTTTGLTPNVQVTAISGAKVKPNTEKGGNIFYFGGHDYNYWTSGGSPNENARLNGKRVLLNAAFIPPSDTMDLDFTTDVALTLSTSGFAVKDEIFYIYIVATNLKGGTAKNVQIPINLSAGLNCIGHSCGIGIYNPGTGVWTIGNIARSESDTLVLQVAVTQLGPLSVSGTASNTALEVILPNNSAVLNFTGVSRPVAVNDTAIFTGPYFLDVNTRANDSDEDGGPFGNTSVGSGPYHGTASVVGTDSIHYIPFANYTGPDSILYITCDNYPLCDTAWLYINVAVPLPVELTHFSGTRKDGKVYLNWLTASEKENDYFAVERSSDGKQFEDRGHVKGAGTTSIEQHYKFNEPDINQPVLYYRLKQVDTNGKFEYSKTIALNLHDKKSSPLTVYPNPVNKEDEIIIRSAEFEGSGTLSIHDITGRIISMKNVTADNGFFEILPANTLQSGYYLINLTSEKSRSATMLIVR